MPDFSKYIDTIMEHVIVYGPKLLLAVIVLFIGLKVIKVLAKFLNKKLLAERIDPTVKPYIVGMFKIILKVALFLTVASMIGIQTTSFVAILGAAGLAVGLALQGNLSNFAAGVMILVFKPFKVGDFIATQGIEGTVREIQIFHTVLNTLDNKRVIIPNNNINSNPITNFSAEDKRRLDLTFGIGYEDDLKKAKEILQNIIISDERAFTDPAPLIAVSELADSSVNLLLRVWTKSSDFFMLKVDLLEKVKLTFDEQGISIPFPQRDLHVYQQQKQ